MLLLCVSFRPAAAADSPTVVPLSPLSNTCIDAVRPTISFNTVTTNSISVVEDSVELFVDTVKVTVSRDENGVWSGTPNWDLNEGTHWVSVALIGINSIPGGLRWSFYVDLSTPTIQITNHNNQEVIVGPNFNIGGTFWGLTSQVGSSIDVRLDIETPLSVNPTWSDNTSGMYSVDLTGVSSGWHWVEAFLTTPGGKVASAGISLHIYVAPPQLIVNSVNGILNSPIITGASACEDNQSWLADLFFSTTTSMQGLYNWNSNTGNVYEMHFTLSIDSGSFVATPNGSIPDGVYTLVAHYTNSDGIALFSSQQVMLDTHPPEYLPFIPAENETLADFSDASLTIVDPLDYFGHAASGVDTASIFVYDTNSGNSMTPVPFTLRDGGILVAGLGDGSYDFTVNAADIAGNTSNYRWQFTVARPHDTDAPQFTPVLPATAEDTLQSPNAILSVIDPLIEGCPRSGIASITVQELDENDQPFDVDFEVVVVSGYESTVKITNLHTGTHRYVITASDAEENSVEYPWTVVVMRTVPTIDGFAPSSDLYLYNPNPVMYVWYSAYNGADIDIETVSVTVIDSHNRQFETTIDAYPDAATATLDSDNLPAEGEITVIISVADTFGNISEPATYTLKVDRKAPTIYNCIPINNSITTGSALVISGNGSDIGSGIDVNSIKILLDGKEINSSSLTVSAENGVLRILSISSDELYIFDQQLHLAEIYVSDAAGNKSRNEIWFNVYEAADPQLLVKLYQNTATLPTSFAAVATYAGKDISSIATFNWTSIPQSATTTGSILNVPDTIGVGTYDISVSVTYGLQTASTTTKLVVYSDNQQLKASFEDPENPNYEEAPLTFDDVPPTTPPPPDEPPFSIEPLILRVIVESAHNKLINGNPSDTNYKYTGGEWAIPTGWCSQPYYSNSVSHTIDEHVELSVTLCAGDPSVSFDLVGKMPVGNGAKLTFSLVGLQLDSHNITIVRVRSDEKLPKRILRAVEGIEWTASLDNAPDYTQTTGPYEFFGIWGEPLDNHDVANPKSPFTGTIPHPDRATRSRMYMAVRWAEDTHEKSDTMSAIASQVATKFSPKDGGIGITDWNAWRMMTDNPAAGAGNRRYDCYSCANACAAMLAILGLKAEARFAFPTTDGTDVFALYDGTYSAMRVSSTEALFWYFKKDGSASRATPRNGYFRARLVFSGDNNFEGFTCLPNEHYAALTVYPLSDAFKEATFTAKCLREGVNGTSERKQFWIWDKDYKDENIHENDNVPGLQPENFGPPERF